MILSAQALGVGQKKGEPQGSPYNFNFKSIKTGRSHRSAQRTWLG